MMLGFATRTAKKNPLQLGQTIAISTGNLYRSAARNDKNLHYPKRTKGPLDAAEEIQL
jgi:hypothetical protein